MNTRGMDFMKNEYVGVCVEQRQQTNMENELYLRVFILRVNNSIKIQWKIAHCIHFDMLYLIFNIDSISE